MINYTWSIEDLQYMLSPADSAGAATTACWKCVGTDEDGKEEAYMGVALLAFPDPSSPDFIAYEDLTEQLILDWCFADGEDGLPLVDVAAVEASIAAQISWVPTRANGRPWLYPGKPEGAGQP